MPEIRFYLPQLLTGVIFFLFGTPLLKVTGILYLLAVLLFHWAAFPRKKKDFVLEQDRVRLIEEVRRMLLFYEDYAIESEHYLPPDNVQEAPLYLSLIHIYPHSSGRRPDER